MSPPLVSVLMPARDEAQTLDAALATVVAQTFEDWEAVVVDDGSLDSTPQLLERWQRRDARIRCLRTGGLGIVGALEHGRAVCRGRYVARMDADDLMHATRLGKQVAVLESNETLAGIGSRIRCFPSSAVRAGMRHYEAWQNEILSPDALWRERFIEAPLVHPSVTLRRDALDSVGGWQQGPWPEDYDLWMRLLERGPVLAKHPDLLHFWRERPQRLTRTDPRYRPEAFTFIRAKYLARGPLASRPAVVWGAGPVGKMLVKALDAEGAKVLAFVELDPRKIGQRIHGHPVVSREAIPNDPDAVLLAAVGAKGARADIRAEAKARGYVEGESFFACA